jgi:hypothetical protein
LLSALKEEGFNASKLSQLVDCLEAGIDIIPATDHKMFKTSHQLSLTGVSAEAAAAAPVDEPIDVERAPKKSQPSTPASEKKKSTPKNKKK